MEQTWRWFGPDDVVRLADARQAGATGIVTALHHIPYGVVWSAEEIEQRKALIAADPSLGLRWSVVESLPVAEPIKLGEGDLEPLFDNYRQSLRNLAACGVTHRLLQLHAGARLDPHRPRAPLPGGGRALRFNAHEFAAFDCFMLERPGAEDDHPPEVVRARRAPGSTRSSEDDRRRLLGNIMAGLPGAFDRYDIPGLRRMLDRYRGMTRDDLRAEPRPLPARGGADRRGGRHPHVHPPGRPAAPDLLGLPRIVGSADDLAFILGAVRRRTPTASPSAPARSAPARQRRAGDGAALRRARSTSPTCATSPRSRTARSWRPTTSAATSTWWRWSRRLLEEQKRRRDAGDARLAHPVPARPRPRAAGRRRQAGHPGLPGDRPAAGLAELRGVMTAVASQRGLPV